MSERKCRRCGQEFSSIQALEKHLQKKKSCIVTLEDISCDVLLTDIYTKRAERYGNDLQYHCPTCQNKYKTSRGLNMHVKNHHNECPPVNTQNLENLLTGIMNRLETMENSKAVQITINSHVTTNNNVQVNNFGSEKVDHIKNDRNFMWSCARNLICKGNGNGIKQLVSRIHFDPEHECNNNVRLKSMKRELMEVFDGDRWCIRDTTESVDGMIRNGYRIMDDYYRNSDTGIREYDENELDSRIFGDLLKLATRDKSIYNYLKKTIIALVVDGTVNKNISLP